MYWREESLQAQAHFLQKLNFIVTSRSRVAGILGQDFKIKNKCTLQGCARKTAVNNFNLEDIRENSPFISLKITLKMYTHMQQAFFTR